MRRFDPNTSLTALHTWRNVAMGAAVLVVVVAVLGHATGYYTWGWSFGGILVGVAILAASHDVTERRAMKLAQRLSEDDRTTRAPTATVEAATPTT